MRIILHKLSIIAFILCISNVVRGQAPVADFSANITTSCAPAIVSFTDLSTGSPTSWNWDLGNSTTATNQNPTTTYIMPGTYTVILTAVNASGSGTKTRVSYITIIPTPTVAFTSTDTAVSCVPKTVQFTNQTIPNSSVGTVNYSWDFGDGATSTLANPSHIYTTPGTYNVTLVVVNGTGCISTLTKSAYIHAAPKAIAGFTTANNNSCTAPVTVNFNNTSTGAISYLWNFGDGNTSTAISPSHTYTTAGSYTVKLIAVSAAGCHDTITMPAIVNIGNLAASFTQSAATTCTNTTISFTNTSTTGATLHWHFGDGDTSTQTNPAHKYSTPGTYVVKLVSSFNNCSDSTTRTIVVTPGPSLQFSATNNLGCSVPLTVNFTNTSAGGTSYLWLFGDGATSTALNPSYTYTIAGQYTVTLIGTNSNGCKDTLVKVNFVKASPLSGQIDSVPVTSGCVPATVIPYASINSAVPVVSYQWNFGDGNTGTGINPSHVYTTSGIYTMTLTATTSAGCTFTTTTSVQVGSHVLPSFTATPTNICAGQIVTFQNTTGPVPNVNFSWFFGDGSGVGSFNATHQYNNIGTFTPMLVSSFFGCTDTFKIPNLITVTPPLAEFNFVISCINQRTVTLTDASIGAISWLWDFGDGSTFSGQNPPAHTYASTGTYTISLTVTNGTCTHVKTSTIKLFNLNPDFTAAPNPVCSGTPITFTATADPNIASYTWLYGDGNGYGSLLDTSTHLYASTGTYTPVLIVKDINGCSDTIKKLNYIKINGINPNFTVSNTASCGLAIVTFTDLSTTSVSPVVSRIWDFGDSTILTTTSTTITHTYATSGVYTVKLKVSDSLGCENSMTKIAYVTVTRPTAAFTSVDTNICQNRPVAFTNTSTGVAALSYSWDFGDGFTSTASAPTHSYLTAGTYTVRLISIDVNGCRDTLIRPNYIKISAIAAGFIPSDTLGACPPLTVNYTNISVGATSYLWNFGNGNTSTSANPSNVFTQPGLYMVTLKITNASGCTDSIKKTIRVKPGPTGTFSYMPVSGCVPLTINFSSTNANTTSLTFDFNNGNTHTTTASTYSYTYTQPGNYLPVLILSNGAGCNISIVGPDTIKAAKIYAGFKATPDTTCLGSAISFTDTSSSVATIINSHSWNFGDGNTSTATSPSHTYTAPGTYNVRLIVNGTTGCKDTTYRTVVVQTVPVLVAQDKIICAGGSVTLAVSGASTYNWSPATGLSCTNCANPVANPATTTTYTVTGTAAGGCSSTKLVTVSVNPVPLTLTATGATICDGASAILNAAGAASYLWSPGTGLSCTSCANPSANPTTTTTYVLTGTSAAGCSNSINVTVNVNPKPVVTTSNQQICVGGTANLSASGAVSYSWSPSTGLSCTNCASPAATPASTTTYTVTGTNANGCTNTAQAIVTVTNLPVITVSGNTTNCLGTGASLSANGAVSYAWTPATGLSCTNCANPIATPTATTTYTVTGTITAGCVGTTNVTVTVRQPPTVTAGNNVGICSGSAVTLNAGGAATYSWTPSTGLSCTSCANPSANPSSTTTYTVIGTDAFGCTNTSTVTVTVLPKPTITTANTMICAGGSVTISANGGTTYLWSPATGLSCTNCASPVASPATTTTYTVTGTDVNGCTNTAQAIVTVTTLPVITVSGNTTNCLGTGASLTANGAVTYTWTPATGLSCTNCANPVATPTSNTTYTVTGTISAGCTGTTTVNVVVRQPPVVTAGNSVSTCTGIPVTLTGTGASTYSWTPSSSLSCSNCASPSANPSATTTYTVTGTDAFGCTDTGVVTVTVLPKPTIATSNQSMCAGGSATLSASGGASYVWSPASGLSCTNCANTVATPAATTLYTVTGTGANGCTNTAQATVTVNPLPVVSVSGNPVVCPGGGANLVASGAASYLWSPATGLNCTSCPNPTATPATTTTYTVTGTSTTGCISTTTVTVTVRPAPVVTAGNSQSTCLGTPVSLNASGASTYVWTPITGLSCTNCQNPSASPATTTTYIVTGTDAFGCKDTGAVVVAIKPLPIIITSPDTSICKLTSVQLNVTGGSNYVWSPATGLSCTTCNNPVASPGTNITYTVTGTGANGCINTDQVTINQYPQPQINAGADQTLCAGKSIQLTASGGSTYIWSPTATLSCATCANPMANPVATTTYSLTGTDVHGCTDSDKVVVNVIQHENVFISNSGEICDGESFPLIASGGSDYAWFPPVHLNNSMIANPIASPTSTTTYHVVIRQGQCFADTLSTTIEVHPLPVVDAGADRNITGGTTTQLNTTGTNILSYLWTPGDDLSCTTCASPIAAPKKTTTYTVNVQSDFGCKAKDDVTLFVTCEGKQLWLPNTFTPNGDGQNDRFYPHGRGINTVLRFRIYDRWGEVLYDRANVPTDDESYGWDGIYKNQLLKPDVYVYVIVAQCSNGDTVELKGDISLIR